mmetsp:Transcript_21674/g.51393  ORF Transcript_21674/g.51393 Transcript_21674/m.51393 type:complete len:460 (+) Transcript_21674:199-1578(+)
MGKNSGRKKSQRKNNTKKNKKNNINNSSSNNNNKPTQPESNFFADAGPGCYIARRNNSAGNGRVEKCPEWMIGWEDVDPNDFGIDDDNDNDNDNDDDNDRTLDEIPDVALDPDDCTLTICNPQSRTTKVVYVTVFETAVVGGNGRELILGSTTDNDGKTWSCVTFIVLCPPRVFCHLCYLDIPPGTDLSDVRIESDVSEWRRHPDPSDEHPFRIGFPLDCGTGSGSGSRSGSGNGTAITTKTKTKTSSFLCTQGEDGELTHFFSGNLHAIDFRCPVGTPLLAVGDGTVLEANDGNTLTGISVTNLFRWNSILIQLETVEAGGDGDADGDADGNGQRNDNDNGNNNNSNGNSNDNDAGGNGGPLFVEYVHISRSLVRAGDKVTRGQVIGYSGSVGFSPEPHLHFSAFRSSDADAPTVRVLFESSSESYCSGSDPDTAFLPRAGEWYNASGVVVTDVAKNT